METHVIEDQATPRAFLAENAALTVERIDQTDALEGLREEWNALADDIPFRRWEWLEAWWRHFRTQRDRLSVLAVRDDAGQLVGLAPWYLHRSWRSGRCLRFLGSGMVCSDHLTVMCRPGATEAVVGRVADWLADRVGEWDFLELVGVDADDPAIAQLADRLGGQGMRIDRWPGTSCWALELPETWPEYEKRLSKSRRERVRKILRRQFETGRAVLRRAARPEELEHGFAIFRELHQRRRQSLGDPGCFATPAFGPFLREAVERFREIGRLRLQWVELEGRPVAAEVDLLGSDRVYFYQSGMDPDAADERPGWMMITQSLKTSTEEGRRHFDFLRGDETYKSHWRAEACPTLELRAAPRRVLPLARLEIRKRKEQLKRWLKSRSGR